MAGRGTQGTRLRRKGIRKQRVKNNWSVYIVRCADGTYYTGATNNVLKRVKMHNAGLGARYTRARRPVELVYRKGRMSKPAALTREYAIKQLPRAKKEMLIHQAHD